MGGGADAGPAELPAWEPGTATVLTTVDDAGAPHAIPVSTALRAGPRAVLLGLAPGRGSLANLRARPQAALCVLGTDAGFTAYGAARVVDEDAAGVVAVRLEVGRIQDHRRPTFALQAPVAWRWTDAEAQRRDAAVRAALEALAADG
jgi:hypothetical protein